MKYKFFSHTADAKFQAYGESMEEAFSNAAEAMFSVMVDPSSIKPVYDETIKVEAQDSKALLYAFLEELLFLLDTKAFLLNSVKKLVIYKIDDKHTLEATLLGDINLQQYEIHGEVKAVTYNEMEIIEEEGKVTLQVVVDL
jgi:SHS2 domain-containing protein